MDSTYLIIDLEATCWERGQEQGRRNEIIEIGAVLVDEGFEIVGEAQTFVRPKANPQLSDYCTKLTSITQFEVDRAPELPEALSAFCREVEQLASRRVRQLEFLSWGFYDQKQFARELAVRQVKYPFGPHRSLKHEFAKRHAIKPCGMAEALRILAIPLSGTHHRGIDDARNIAQIFRVEWGRKQIPSQPEG